MKMKCEATCGVCYFSGGRRQEFDENDLLWFCEACKKVFFCEIGLAQDYDHLGKKTYSCPQCRTILVKQEVDKVIIAKKMLPSKKIESHEMYHDLMEEKKTKKRKFFRKDKKTKVSAYIHSQISELADISGLNNQIILEIGKIFNLEVDKKLKKSLKKNELLMELAQEDEKFLEFLYNSIFTFEATLEAFKLRIALYFSQREGESISFQFESGNSSLCDMKIIDKTGNEIWIFCTEEDLDIDNLESLANRAFSIDYLKQPQLKAVYIIAKSFSYMALSMIDKYKRALTAVNQAISETDPTTWKALPIILWCEVHRTLEFKELKK